MLSALLLAASHLQSTPLNLFRGAAVASPAYWDVQDTYLDSTAPETGFGGSYTLLGGKGKTILIRFGDLNRLVGPHKHVVSAALFLTPSGGDPPSLKSAGRLLRSWGEGPHTVISNVFVAPPKPGVKPPPLHWVATYKSRKAGMSNWQAPGAIGGEDQVAISSAHMETVGKEISIAGLEEAVQTMIDRPEENDGFALDFASSSEFYSSKSPNGIPRLEITTENGTVDSGPDLSVISITTEPAAPRNGESVTYTATVKNVGHASSQGFTGQWLVDDKPGTSVEKREPIAADATATFTMQRRFEASPTDHRVSTVAMKISPTGPDGCPEDKELSIFDAAVPVSVAISPDLQSQLGATNYLGSTSWEDWVQSQVKLWNDTVATESVFSFAPEGALERIRINSLQGSDQAVAVPQDAGPTRASVEFLKRLSIAAGCLDGNPFQIPASKVHVNGSVTRSTIDLFPGLTGYGDTRFDGSLPGAIPIEFDSVYDPAMRGMYLPSTDLLSANDVSALNHHLEGRPNKPSDDLLPFPKAVILRVLDMQGTPLPDTDLLFFQSSNGSIPTGNPVFAVKSNEKGIAILNTRGNGGPFGDLSPNADNGVFLVQAKTNGVLETTWLKAWQLSEAAIRESFTFDLRLNLPGAPVDKATNLSLDRIITDSLGDLPAKLAPLIDDAEDTNVDLPDEKGSWVDIDLGRDRYIGEVDLVTNGKPFWQQFDIVTYATGQKPTEGSLWARELNWPWTSLVRRDAAKIDGSSVIAYRGSPQRIRYVRLINKSGGSANLSEIRIFPAKIND